MVAWSTRQQLAPDYSTQLVQYIHPSENYVKDE